MIIKNRKASYNYFLSDEYVAGMVLKGDQVKNIRHGKVSLNESHIVFGNGYEVLASFTIGAEPVHIKLLLNKREIDKLRVKVGQKGFTVVPVNIHISRGMFKMRIALAKGKKMYDKRETIKERDLSRKI